MKEKV